MSFFPVPDVMKDDIYQIPARLFTNRGIRFIMLDVDNTIAPYTVNEASPRLTVPAVIVDKQRKTHHHHSGGHHHHTHSYHVTFQVESGDRMELKVIRSEYDMLLVGDRGRVSFQGTRYLGFERGLEEPDETVI